MLWPHPSGVGDLGDLGDLTPPAPTLAPALWVLVSMSGSGVWLVLVGERQAVGLGWVTGAGRMVP